MRYHYQKPSIYFTNYGKVYTCNHPVYNRCTLYTIGEKGLAVIQQRYSPETKQTWWSEIDDCLIDALYLTHGFKKYFDERGRKATERAISNCHGSSNHVGSEIKASSKATLGDVF